MRFKFFILRYLLVYVGLSLCIIFVSCDETEYSPKPTVHDLELERPAANIVFNPVPKVMKTLFWKLKKHWLKPESLSMVRALFPTIALHKRKRAFAFDLNSEDLNRLLRVEVHYFAPAGEKFCNLSLNIFSLAGSEVTATVRGLRRSRGWNVLEVTRQITMTEFAEQESGNLTILVSFDSSEKERVCLQDIKRVRRHHPFMLLFYSESSEFNRPQARKRRSTVNNEVYTSSELRKVLKDKNHYKRINKYYEDQTETSTKDDYHPNQILKKRDYSKRRRASRQRLGSKGAGLNKKQYLSYPKDWSQKNRRKQRRNRKRKQKTRRRNRKNKNQRNSINSPVGVSQNISCQRKSMVIDFEDIGWQSWVIAPKAFRAYFCDGSCKYRYIDKTWKPTNHAVLQSLVNKLQPNLRVPSSKCVPTNYDSMTLLYYDTKGNLVLRNYPEMIATGCGCR